MFDVYLATLKKTNEKNEIRKNLHFRGQKWGVSSRGKPFRPLRGLKGYPAFDLPHFQP